MTRKVFRKFYQQPTICGEKPLLNKEDISRFCVFAFVEKSAFNDNNYAKTLNYRHLSGKEPPSTISRERYTAHPSNWFDQE